MKTADKVLKAVLPWVYRFGVGVQTWELLKEYQELKAQIDQTPLGKERAKHLHKLANLEVELEKTVAKFK